MIIVVVVVVLIAVVAGWQLVVTAVVKGIAVVGPICMVLVDARLPFLSLFSFIPLFFVALEASG